MKAMILAETGFGKTISAVGNPEVNIEGLDPKLTYFISATSKPLPRRGSAILYPVTTLALMLAGDTKSRRIITNDAYEAAKIIEALIPTPIENLVIDDSNYFMQDFFMEKALATGWDAPKKIGHMMHKLFSAIEKADAAGKHIFMMAHYEDFKKSNTGDISFRMKTTGKSVQEYITPEGKFDIVLFGKAGFDNTNKVATKEFVTNNDGEYPAKSAPGMFTKMYIPNDLGYVLNKIKGYYSGEDAPIIKVEAPAVIADVAQRPMTPSEAIPAPIILEAPKVETATNPNPQIAQPVK